MKSSTDIAEPHDKLREKRNALGLSQQEAADRLEVAYSTYRAYESGRNTPRSMSWEEALGRLDKSDSAITVPSAGRNANLVKVPELAAGAGNEHEEEPNGGLMLPERWVRQTYGVKPERLCIIRVRGDSMRDTLQAGQRVYAARYAGEPLQDGAIYALRLPLGFAIKRIRFGYEGGEDVIWIWSDNDNYAQHRHHVTRQRFDDEYEIIAQALDVSYAL